MKVIKRDGRAVDYDRTKIQTAIEKANKEVSSSNRASKEDIKGIIKYIEDLDKKRILVEDIQDIIEEKLMELKKYELAKKYIVYRYTRALVRKQNTTDETILGIIRNDNNEEYSTSNNMTTAEQRNFIAGEVSRDLTKRLLLPEKIAKADEDGILHFHNKDYFIHQMINSSLINISDMLDNGTAINGKLIESPKSFLTACIITAQIMEVVASNQYGSIYIDAMSLGKYLRKSYDNHRNQIEKESKQEIPLEFIENLIREKIAVELSQGIQMIQYQINTLEAINGKKPCITIFLHLDEKDEYIKENVMIVEEFLKQRYDGIKDSEGQNITPEYPNLLYILNDENSLKGGKYDYITKLALKSSIKRKSPSYFSIKAIEDSYLPILKEYKFNQGVVTINLPQIAILSEENEKEFWRLLDEKLDLCFEALMCRHYSLVGTLVETSPIHWQCGGISRLSEGERIDKLLYGKYSTITLGYIGLNEMTKALKGISTQTTEGNEFALKVLQHLKETIDSWKKGTNINFVLCGINSKEIGMKFSNKDKEKFGTIKDVTDKAYYTNSNLEGNTELLKILEAESKYEKMSLSEKIVDIKQNKINDKNIEEILKYTYDKIGYITFK